MFLTGDGALLAIGLAALVCGTLGTWTVLRWSASTAKDAKTTPRGSGKVGSVRRTITSTGTAPKV